MTRITIILGAIVLLLAGAFFAGIKWNDNKEAEKKAATLERINDANTSKGDADDDRSWVFDFVSGLSKRND